MESKLTLVKIYLEASSKDELISKQLQNNVAFGHRFIYDPPMKDGKKWVTWYFADIENQIMKKALSK